MSTGDACCSYCLCPALEFSIRPACSSHPLSYDLDGDWDDPCTGCGVVPRDLIEFRLEHLTAWRDFYNDLWADLEVERSGPAPVVERF